MPPPSSPTPPLPPAPRGRGAAINPTNRFESLSLHVLGDHLDHAHAEALAQRAEDHPAAPLDPLAPPDAPRLPTTTLDDRTRSIINPVDSPDVPMRWTVNPYRGCEHGCIYCYARPGHEYLGMSSGIDFETKIMVKRDAPALLRKELSRPSWLKKQSAAGATLNARAASGGAGDSADGSDLFGPDGARTGTLWRVESKPQLNAVDAISFSGVTDCYQPIERELRITRQCLEVCLEFHQPVGIITKNRLITRDLDLLSRFAQWQGVHAAISLTTLDPALAGKLEPRASSPRDRLRAISELAAAGIPVTVMTAPIIPGLNDREIPALLEAARNAGATGAGYVMMRLPWQIKDLFLDWLRRHFPDRAAHVENLVRDVRSGNLNDPRFRARMRGTGALADTISSTFKLFRKRFELDRPSPALNGELFRVPESSGPDSSGQTMLFGPG